MENHSDINTLVSLAKKASVYWESAGIECRLRILQEASDKLLEHTSTFEGFLRAARFPGNIAKTYSQWSIGTVSAKALELQARDLVQQVNTGVGQEMIVRRADGVVLLSLPISSASFNSVSMFPILLAGNAIVICVHPNANDSGVRFVAEDIIKNTLERNGFSRDLISLVTGYPREIASKFMDTLGNTIVYFGNWENGDALAQEAYAKGKKVVLELDGGDFMVVWDDAPMDRVTDSACRAFDIATHPCFVPRHFLVHEGVIDKFIDSFLSKSSCYSTTVEADVEKGVLIPISQMEEFIAAFNEVKQIGKVHCGGYRMKFDGTQDDEGIYVAPTIVSLDAKDCLQRSLLCFDKEVFFPLITVVKFSGDKDEVVSQMLNLINNNPFGLRTSLWSHDLGVIEKFARGVNSVGLLRFNEDHCVNSFYASFWGGPKRSGGPYGELNLFWQKTTHIQAIDCKQLTNSEIDAVKKGLGVVD